ncbi:hypothetical protein AYI69_g5193 [Smittium culicis]|uniref:Uncharacterized protein n=1 Tax=Smittium culicis TaxID=133412 RepID=A0A1R1Y7U5_9FUNG|nr:hypothetical protein AYI69_g5193 [Smittium culicis]
MIRPGISPSSYPNVGLIDLTPLKQAVITDEIRIAVVRWACAQKLSQTVLNEWVPPVSRWSSSGIAVLRIAGRCLHYPQPRIV